MKPNEPTPAPRRRRRTAKKETASRNPLVRYPIASLCAGLGLLAIVIFWGLFGFNGYSGPERWIYVPPGATSSSLRDSLKSNLGMMTGNRSYLLWRLMGGRIDRARGMYRIADGDRALSISRRLRAGSQSPVKVGFRGARSFDKVAARIASQMEFTPEEFISACDSVLPAAGFKKEEYMAAFLPDTYEFYITDSPAKVAGRLLDYRNNFWTDERRAKAREMQLTPVGVATIASIVEEESAKRDERPTIARLYVNRVTRHMRLQADPTVKFAIGDFTLRRITGLHLRTPSPYNTYLVDGLPPGPIRMPERATLEAVLDAPPHDYIYMCARHDFSGYHNFARTIDEHNRNAALYRQELNRRNIH